MLLLYAVGGLSTWFWHCSSILLHVTVTYLVYRFIVTFLRSSTAAFVGAVLFAAHPIHVDAVSWVSASNELLFTCFVLASLITLANAARARKQRWIALSLGFYVAALLSKETAVAIVPIFPLAWWLAKGETAPLDSRPRSTALRIGVLYSIPALLYLAIRSVVLQGTGAEGAKHAWGEMVYSGPSLILFYFKKLLWPVRLAGFYVNPLSSSLTLHNCAIAGGLILASGLLLWLSHRFSALFTMAGALLLLPLLPVLGGVLVYDQGNMTHDRYLYLPSVGLSLLLGLIVSKAWSAQRARWILAATGIAILVSIVYATVRQQAFYRDDISSYGEAIDTDPTNTLVMGYLGDVYLEQKQNDRAIGWFERAIKIAPDDYNAKFYLARGLMKSKQFSAALPRVRELAYDQGKVSTFRRSGLLLYLANAQIELNRLDDAKKTLSDLSQFNPSFPGLHRTLGIVFQREGSIEQAREEYALEFRTSGDRESGNEAIALGRSLGHVNGFSRP